MRFEHVLGGLLNTGRLLVTYLWWRGDPFTMPAGQFRCSRDPLGIEQFVGVLFNICAAAPGRPNRRPWEVRILIVLPVVKQNT
jgi:hypothetical protein